jgi:isopenicillin N synthase-like dioxygenase
MKNRVPELSLADYQSGETPVREAFSAALLHSLQRYGFIILTDHPVPSALIDRAYASSAQFFAEDEEVKRRYVGGPRGYAPFRTEHAKNQSVPDLKEFWQIGPEHTVGGGRAGADRVDAGRVDAGRAGPVPPNLWPASPAQFKETFLALFDALQETGRIILEALTPGLSLPKEFFEPLLRERNSVLRLLHYPPIAADAEAGSTRSAAHEDINLITLLLAPQGPGLELLDREGRWLSVETRRNNLIVDSGDMLARMTNDVIPATTHRVVNPSAQNVSRYSMPFFMHPDADVVLRCVPSCIGAGAKYPEVTAGTFLEERLSEIGLIEPRERDAGAGR